MWFKNIRIYPLETPISLSGHDLEKALANQAFSPCAANQKISCGFVSALLDEPLLTFSSGSFTTVRLQIQERVLPAAAIKDVTEERVASIEASEGRKLSARQKRELKEQIVEELMPKALTKSRRIRAFWSSDMPWIAVGTATATHAELLLSQLREALGSLPVSSANFGQSPIRLMSDWVTHGAIPDPWSVEDEVEWFDPKDIDCRARLKGWSMADPMVQEMADRKLLVSKLRITWKDAIQATLTKEGVLTRIQYDAALNPDDAADHMEPLSRKAHEFSVMATEVSSFLKDFMSLLQAQNEG